MFRSRIAGVLASMVLGGLVIAAPAQAAFPGANGKIAFSEFSPSATESQIYLINPDGTGRTQVTQGPGAKFDSSWSPDGRRLAFTSDQDDPNPASCSPCNYEIYVIEADGQNLTRLTNSPGLDEAPAWSPDGTKILFESARSSPVDIYSMNADGSGVTRQTFSGKALDPAWSPDGTKIAFSGYAPSDPDDREIVIVDSNFGNPVDLTNDPSAPEWSPDWSPNGQSLAFGEDYCGYVSECTSFYGTIEYADTIRADGILLRRIDVPIFRPVWSPDGSRIALAHQNCPSGSPPPCGYLDVKSEDIVTMNPDGSAKTNVTSNPDGVFSGSPSWQPVLISGYPRPKGATPLWVSLVPAYRECTNANTTHGSPLTYGSCKPPVQTSSYLTVGTPDSNSQAANAVGSVRMRAVAGDVLLDASITDVRNKSDLSDYGGTLQVDASLRITDKNNTPDPGGFGPGTVSDTTLPVTIPCAATADTRIGSTCSLSTTVNSVYPGAIVAGKRSIWQLGQVKVYDGGTDGLASTTADNTLFLDQGVFVP
jgi:Tol biopolymer transport system component